MQENRWDNEQYHGRYNRYPFTEVVSFVMQNYGSADDRSGVKILDLGCGGAHHLEFLAREGFDYYGIDGAKESIEISHNRLKALGFKTDTIFQCDFPPIPYPDNYFDCIIDRGTLVCNNLNDIKQILVDLARILKPRGKLFSLLLNEESSSRQLGTHIGDNDYTDFTGRLSGAGVLHFTNTEEAKDIYSKDFKIETIEILKRTVEYTTTENHNIHAWTASTCIK